MSHVLDVCVFKDLPSLNKLTVQDVVDGQTHSQHVIVIHSVQMYCT